MGSYLDLELEPPSLHGSGSTTLLAVSYLFTTTCIHFLCRVISLFRIIFVKSFDLVFFNNRFQTSFKIVELPFNKFSTTQLRYKSHQNTHVKQKVLARDVLDMNFIYYVRCHLTYTFKGTNIVPIKYSPHPLNIVAPYLPHRHFYRAFVPYIKGALQFFVSGYVCRHTRFKKCTIYETPRQ